MTKCFKFVSKHWNIKIIKAENISKSTLSIVSKRFETNWNIKRWKFQTPYLVFRNIETYRLCSKTTETYWNRLKISKSTLSIVSKRFETNWNKKGENSGPHIWCFEALKHIDYILNWLNQIETGENVKVPFLVFRNIETYRIYYS